MQGDYSRFTFDQRKHYNGVLVQQGRAQLDADTNEHVAIQAHRDRAEATDTIGPCGVPKIGGGFRIVSLGAGELDLGITAGRMYVDGILCEVGGNPISVLANPADNQVLLGTLNADGTALKVGEWVELSSRTQSAGFFKVTAVDPAGRRLTLSANAGGYKPTDGAVIRRAVTYATQPDHPAAPKLAPNAGDRLLLFLDVWERHVTAVEDPAIREVALGGSDTTARIQTVCQIKFHPQPVSDQLGCDDPISDWPPTASGGLLSATDTAAPPSEDPCRIAPDGGFRGLENRLYRVEIHKRGGLGVNKATFKWSRDNGAVVFAVDKILDKTGGRVSVRRLGRDDVLTLHEDDWVEVVDDTIELSGQPGVLARATNINQLDRSLTLKPPVPGLDPERHPRLRRWDVPRADLDGSLPVKAEPTHLEDGVEVRFSGDGFQTGDWWTIPARVLTGQAGRLIDAPPGGITHHYCRLALVKWNEQGGKLKADPVDCRLQFPPLTAIQATDVDYADQLCSLSDDAQVLSTVLGRPIAAESVDNVQEALDVLCVRDSTYQQISYVAGDGQDGQPGTQLPARLTVAVRNAIGEPVPDVDVTFTPVGQGSVSTQQAKTTQAGEATVLWTLGPAAGLNELVAQIAPPQGGSQQVRFNARGTAPQTGGLCSITVGDGIRSQDQFIGPAGLQAAVDAAITHGGGTICVLPGFYVLGEPIVVNRGVNLVIQGSRLETIIHAPTSMAFRFSDCFNVELRDLQVICTDMQPDLDPDGLVGFRGCAGVAVQRCSLSAFSRNDRVTASCLLLNGCRGAIDVRDCELAAGGTGRLAGITLRQTIDARLRANTIRVLADRGSFGIDLEDSCDGCLVVDNIVEGAPPDGTGTSSGSLGGVHVGSGCDQVTVRGNRIDGGAGLGVALGSRDANGDSLGGLREIIIDDNTIRRMAAGGVGVLGWQSSGDAEPPQPVTDGLLLTGNRIETCSYGVAEAHIFPIGVAVLGIRLAGAVALWMGEGMRILDNDIVDNGQFGTSAAPHPVPGIAVFFPGAGLTISRNRVRDNASPNRRDLGTMRTVTGGIVIAAITALESNNPVAMLSTNEVIAPVGPALLLLVNRGSSGNVQITGNHFFGEGENSNVAAFYPGGSVQFVDNQVVTRPTGLFVVVEIRAHHVVFDSNRCVCVADSRLGDHVVIECDGSASATGNHILESDLQERRNSLHLIDSSGTSGPITLTTVANVITNGLVLDPQGANVANLTGILA